MQVGDIKELAAYFNVGAPIVTAVIVFGICVSNIDKLMIAWSHIQKAFSFASAKARKGAISNAIRGNILGSARKLKFSSIGILNADLKIDWVKEESQESFISRNQVIVRMSQSTNPHKNYVTAVNAYVSQALIPHAKRYIDKSILNMSRVSVARLMIVNGDSDATEYFDENVLDPLIGSSAESMELYKRLRAIDKNGMFVNILLNEYAKATEKIYPDDPDPLLVVESSELLTFLYRIAMRVSGDTNELQFNREYFKICISLAAKQNTLRYGGIRPHLKRMQKSVENGIETIYVFGLGWKMQVAQQIVDSFSETNIKVSKVVRHNYKHRSNDGGRSVSGVCYEVRIFQQENE